MFDPFEKIYIHIQNNYTDITNVTFGSNVRVIGNNAFESCNKMIDNFIMLPIVNSQMSDDQIRSISFQLKTYLDIKKA